MKVVFIHDHRFVVVNDNVYSKGIFPARIWERYLQVFDSLIVIARKEETPSNTPIDKLVVSNHPKVQFLFAPNISTPKAWLGAKRKAVKIIEKALQEADALIARLPSELGYLGTQIARKLKKPWAVEVVSCAWDEMWNYGNLIGKLYAPVRFWKTREAVSKAPFVLYVTKSFLQRRYPNYKGVTIACSNVEIEIPSQEILEKRLGRIKKSHKPIVFGLIGSLYGRFKGIQTVFAALQIVRREISSVLFRILGPGEISLWRQEAKKYNVDDIVFFDGILPSGKPVMDWLDNIDIYLQPSFKEGLPRALIEAMSRGCPAIGSTCGGIRELLDETCLIKPGDYQTLAYKMIRMSTDQNWQISQARRNWEVARNFARQILDKRRKAFWEKFAQFVQKAKE